MTGRREDEGVMVDSFLVGDKSFLMKVVVCVEEHRIPVRIPKISHPYESKVFFHYI